MALLASSMKPLLHPESFITTLVVVGSVYCGVSTSNSLNQWLYCLWVSWPSSPRNLRSDPRGQIVMGYQLYWGLIIFIWAQQIIYWTDTWITNLVFMYLYSYEILLFWFKTKWYINKRLFINLAFIFTGITYHNLALLGQQSRTVRTTELVFGMFNLKKIELPVS